MFTKKKFKSLNSHILFQNKFNERSEKNTSEREREREKKKGKTCDIYLFTDAHVFLHAARRCGGPKQFATTFYFECTYGEWRELARLVPGGQN